MTTTPRPLDAFNDELEQQPQTVGQITSQVELIATLLTDENFRAFAITSPNDEVVIISRDGLKQIILAPTLWQSLERRLPYVSEANQATTCVVCTGTHEDFAAFPVDLRRPDIQQLGLPLYSKTLYPIVQNIYNMQTLLAHARATAEEVQEANQAVKYVMSISRELNGERDIPRLLDLILFKAREISSADAGSIYTVDSPTNNLRDGSIQFRLTQNHSIKQNLSKFSLPVNEGSIVGSACIKAVTINIPLVQA